MSLRTALKLDAIVTGANGAAYLVAAGPLEDLLGLSPALLRGIGAFLLLFSAAVWTVALAAAGLVLGGARGDRRSTSSGRPTRSRSWPPASRDPTTLGAIWIVMQALVVAGFAALQAMTRGAARERALAA